MEGHRRVLDYLVDTGSDGICILANFSEQFSLTDEERQLIVTDTLEHVEDSLPVCVTTSHYSARIASLRSLEAQKRGAAMVMLMAPFVGASMTVAEDDVLEYFRRVADGMEIPIMIQDAPMSPTPLSTDLLARLAREIPQVQYVKIEVRDAAHKLRILTSKAGEDLPGLFDGEESVTLIPDLHAGARGTMSSALIPDRLGQIVRTFLGGNCSKAEQMWEEVLPLIHFENRQCGMRAAKVLLKEGGVIRSDKSRAPLQELNPQTRRELVSLARRKQALVLNWA